MVFEDILYRLNIGDSFEQIVADTMVECVGNTVYEDEDLHRFLDSIGSKIIDYYEGFVIISSKAGKYYHIPYRLKKNRFDTDIPDESILLFNYKDIKASKVIKR